MLLDAEREGRYGCSYPATQVNQAQGCLLLFRRYIEHRTLALAERWRTHAAENWQGGLLRYWRLGLLYQFSAGDRDGVSRTCKSSARK